MFFLSRGSSTGGVYLCLWQKGEYSFKGGEHSFRGSKILELQVVNPLEGKSFCFLYAFNVFLFGVWFQRGEVLGTKETQNISNTKHHPISKI